MKILIGGILLACMATVFAVLAFRQQRFVPGTATIGSTQIMVDIAKTTITRARGLSGRQSLPDGTGMAFLFPFHGKHAIWMPDMHFSIDIIWVSDGTIVDIAPHVPPLQAGQPTRTWSPRLPANVVVEVPAGFVEKYGIKIGDPVTVMKK